ncbi:MAG: hypothetical protein HEP71_25605 [Roseivirga sp.]|nr:hypothetical protein [Roseivirga sp.]
MKYTKNQIGDMMDNLKPAKSGTNHFSHSILSASGMNHYCNRQTGEDRFLQGCEDARS